MREGGRGIKKRIFTGLGTLNITSEPHRTLSPALNHSEQFMSLLVHSQGYLGAPHEQACVITGSTIHTIFMSQDVPPGPSGVASCLDTPPPPHIHTHTHAHQGSIGTNPAASRYDYFKSWSLHLQLEELRINRSIISNYFDSGWIVWVLREVPKLLS